MSTITRGREIAALIDGGNTAREMLGRALVLLSSAYELIGTYDPLGVADSITSQGTEYLDGIRTRAEADYKLIPEGNAQLDDKLRAQIGFDIASIETATRQTLELNSQTVFGDALDAAVGKATEIADKLPDLLPSSSSVWIFVALAIGFVLWLKFRK